MDRLSRGYGGSNILLVDDRPENLMALEAVLEPLRHNLVTASSGPDALRRLLDQDFALAILDVQMPGLDGFETAELIRQRDKTSTLPIIFLTAIHAEAGSIKKGFDLGAVDYVTKPFDPDILRAKVRAILELGKVDAGLTARVEELEFQSARLRALVESLEGVAYRVQDMQDQQKVIKDLSETNRLRKDLLAVVAHELRNPLSVIAGLTEIAIENDEMNRAQRRRALGSIARQTRRMVSLVESLLDTSRTFEPRAGTAANVAEIVASATGWVRDSYPDRDVQILASIPDDQAVAIDQTALHLILMNLLSNAVKYAVIGTAVSVTTATHEDRARISVTNIVPEPLNDEELDTLFEPFVQLHRDEGTSPEGVGLGLHIVKRFTELYGGVVSASCTDDAATFTVELPLATSSPPALVDLTETNIDLTT